METAEFFLLAQRAGLVGLGHRCAQRCAQRCATLRATLRATRYCRRRNRIESNPNEGTPPRDIKLQMPRNLHNICSCLRLDNLRCRVASRYRFPFRNSDANTSSSHPVGSGGAFSCRCNQLLCVAAVRSPYHRHPVA